MSSFAVRLLMVLAAAVLIGGCGGEETAEYYGSISVTGQGTAYGDADVASIVFGVDLIEDDPGVAVDNAAVMMEEAFAAAAEMGIAESDMKTTSYSLWAEEQYDYGTYTYTGKVMYHVTHYAQVDVRDLEQVGQVLSALVSSGSNTIQGVSFSVEDSQTLMEQAR
ncbi:MAG: SIMPL domain-containing protein, partial [Candidatus Fermentibacteraceae bacterium]|nr:SIMPL domain-containing protein [Candidatus Fermentibacteraceae bacterium]